MATKQEIERILNEVDGAMAYHLFCERDSAFGNVFEMCRQMVSWGRTPEDIVDSIIGGMDAENQTYAREHPYVRELLVRATRYAGDRLRDQAKVAEMN